MLDMDDLFFLELFIPNFDKILQTIGLIMLILGLVNAFFGYKIFRVMLVLIGFLVGALAGGMISIYIQFNSSSDIGLFWVFVLIGGLVCAALAGFFHHLGVFLATGAMGVLVGFLMIQNTAAALVIGVLVGLFSVLFEKYVVIFSTGISGGRLAALGIQYIGMAGGEYMDVRAVGWGIAIVGIIVQLLLELSVGKQVPKEAASGGTGAASGVKGEGTAAVSSETKSCGNCGYDVTENGAKENIARENGMEENGTKGNTVKENGIDENDIKGNTIKANGVNENNIKEKTAGGYIYCGKCGTKLPAYARFCSKCGTAQN